VTGGSKLLLVDYSSYYSPRLTSTTGPTSQYEKDKSEKMKKRERIAHNLLRESFAAEDPFTVVHECGVSDASSKLFSSRVDDSSQISPPSFSSSVGLLPHCNWLKFPCSAVSKTYKLTTK
jgi:hypothetical protein